MSIFVEGASIPGFNQETIIIVRFAKHSILAKQLKKQLKKMMTRVEAEDAGAICEMGNWYLHGRIESVESN